MHNEYVPGPALKAHGAVKVEFRLLFTTGLDGVSFTARPSNHLIEDCVDPLASLDFSMYLGGNYARWYLFIFFRRYKKSNPMQKEETLLFLRHFVECSFHCIVSCV